MAEFDEMTRGYTMSTDLLVQVIKLAAQRGFRVYRHSVSPAAKEFRLLLMCAQY